VQSRPRTNRGALPTSRTTHLRLRTKLLPVPGRAVTNRTSILRAGAYRRELSGARVFGWRHTSADIATVFSWKMSHLGECLAEFIGAAIEDSEILLQKKCPDRSALGAQPCHRDAAGMHFA
jgi:hypothetical protein